MSQKRRGSQQGGSQSQRRRVEIVDQDPDSDEDVASQSQGTGLSQQEIETHGAKIARFLLFHERSKKPIPRAELKKAVMKDHKPKQFNAAFAHAKKLMSDMFGYGVEELPAEMGEPEPSETGASQSQSQGGSSQGRKTPANKSRILLTNELPRTEMSAIKKDDAVYLGLVTVVLGCIDFSEGKIAEDEMYAHLEIVGLKREEPIPHHKAMGSLQDLVKRMLKELYIYKSDGQFCRGARAGAELSYAQDDPHSFPQWYKTCVMASA